jgi:hypothetical protein
MGLCRETPERPLMCLKRADRGLGSISLMQLNMDAAAWA